MKVVFLSLGGRLTLVNSIISAIPTYYLSVLHLSAKVEYEMDKIRRLFLWKSHLGSNQGYCLAKWKVICSSKKHDGLGIINLRNFSIAVKSKLLWQLFATCPHLKWLGLIRSKYFFRNQARALLNVTVTRHLFCGRNSDLAFLF